MTVVLSVKLLYKRKVFSRGPGDFPNIYKYYLF
jgi:hypothetical protein